RLDSAEAVRPPAPAASNAPSDPSTPVDLSEGTGTESAATDFVGSGQAGAQGQSAPRPPPDPGPEAPRRTLSQEEANKAMDTATDSKDRADAPAGDISTPE